MKFDRAFKEFLKISSYQLIGLAAIGLTPLINKTMATWLEIGSVSLFDYAYKLYAIPLTFMGTGLMVTLLSHWSIKYYEGYKQENFKNRVNKTVNLVFLISLSITLILILFRYPCVNFAFGRGKFAMDKLTEVSNIFLFFLFGFAPNIIAGLYIRYFITIKHTKIYLKISLARNLIILIFNFLFLKTLGLKGLALSTTMVAVFEASMYRLAFKRKEVIYKKDEKF